MKWVAISGQESNGKRRQQIVLEGTCDTTRAFAEYIFANALKRKVSNAQTHCKNVFGSVVCTGTRGRTF